MTVIFNVQLHSKSDPCIQLLLHYLYLGFSKAPLRQRVQNLTNDFPLDLPSSNILHFSHHHYGKHHMDTITIFFFLKSLSHVRLFATLWTVAYQAPLSMRFSRQEYWSGLPFPSPGDLPDPEIEPGSSALESDALTSEPPGKPTIYLQKLKI